MHKTGTTSMSLFFRKQLNLKTAFAFEKLIFDWRPGFTRKALDMAEGYDAFQDHPWPIIFRQMDDRFPGSKFIFYERNVDEWYDSCYRWFGRKESPLRNYIYGCGSPVGNEKAWKDTYLRHSDSVRNHFKHRPGDFLEVPNLSDKSAKKIGKFVGHLNPSCLWMPNVNNNNEQRNMI